MASTLLPSISVVVPNYNHAKYLEFSLSAILRQSVTPLEVIVLDDASTDNSVEVIQWFAAQHPVVRLVQNRNNLGVMPNINKGVELSRGEYVYVASADDEIVPGLFEKSLRLLAQHPQAAFCCAITEWREVASGLTWHMATGMGDQPCFLSPDEMVRLGKKGKLFIVTSSCVQKREPLLKAGIFPPELRWHADWFAMYVTGFRDGICFVPEILSTANILPGSFYQSGHKKTEHEQVLVKLLDHLNSEKYADVAPRIRDSGALSMFAMPLLRLMLRRPEYRHFITTTFLRKTLRRSAELKAKKYFPTWLARWCLNRFYRFRKG
ncbi:MAG: glycosyltransferase family A protein [Verrucomicrobiota bacterium]